MFADELERLDKQMGTRVRCGMVVAHEEPARWGVYQVGALAWRVGQESDRCPTCRAMFIDHKQYIRHRAECAASSRRTRRMC